MTADRNRTHGVFGIPLAWREKFRYSNLSNKSKRKHSRWKEVLFPCTLPGSRKAEEGSDWIKGVVVCTCITGLILAINIILTITATVIAYRRQSNRGQFQMAELYNGQCARSSHWATGLHVVINVLSTVLLGASNYVMQSLGAPSRADIDQAHAKSRWLDIGTASFRNFTVMDTRRKVLWVLLLISSTPIHMIYNSAIFSSISDLRYGTFMIPNDLSPNESLTGDTTSHEIFLSHVGTDETATRAQIFNGSFINATNADCVSKYNVEYNTKYGTLVFVADRQHFPNTSSLMVWGSHAWPGPYGESIYNYFKENYIPVDNWTMQTRHWSYRVWNYSAPNHIQDDFYDKTDALYRPMSSFNFRDDTRLGMYGSYSNTDDLLTLANYNFAYNPSRDALREYLDNPAHWTNSSWAANVTFELIGNGSINLNVGFDHPARHVPTSHCLIKEAEEHCQLFFSPPIAIVVIICNATKVICMLLTTRGKRRDLMLTVGDALSSFLTRPDSTTRGRCLLSYAEMTRGAQAWSLPAIASGQSKGYTVQQQAASPTTLPLKDYSTSTQAIHEVYPGLLPRRKRWYQAASWTRWATVLFFCICSIVATIYLFVLTIPSGSTFESAMSLGFGKTSGDNMIGRLSSDMIALVLLANTPQILLSVLYFVINSILTCMLVAAEWDRYARHRRPLRVSWPRGQQRSTYYLSLPYRYSLPLLALSATLHWLVSQSIFFVNIRTYFPDGREDEESSSRGCCYSPMAMFIALWMGIFALGLLLGTGARRFESHMPLATHCSAAISAACHPPEGDAGAAEKPVIWGEIPRGEEEQMTEYTGAGTEDESVYAHCSFTSLDVVEPSLGRMYC
ncbi:uncharacterized protein LDX57_007519 [Aspergillus melleus]|uniref:uncharacterized protein n=1 Tax=Aspergillus melleus TaxID=138277 RepID=UPI001E8E6520|nr:uncharacterized protein LDX57_007519 [Aspergillus melleus]KAH8429848.1 hypothetical protein LDX57_007519 [Aspergillus melleus]